MSIINILFIILSVEMFQMCILMMGYQMVPHMLVFLQRQFPVQSGGQHVAGAGTRTHGLPEPGTVLCSDAV